ncbi:MAG TPA: sulfatase-like hydrolase/transferase [Candidatus Dormibacteraeota bacterium]|nr:sulfatase-like hydrolase/transferase [Candidatus Dormibacteraeota bacterium]
MKRRSLILVTVDCLRADHVGFQGYACPVTPFLDSVAKNSVVVSDAVVAGAPTYFSFPAIMASRYPLGLGREILGIAPDELTLATALQEAGFATAAFLAGNPYLSPRFGYDQGFDEFHDFLDSDSSGVTTAPLQRSSPLSGVNRGLEAIARRTRLTATAYDELYFRYCQWISSREDVSLDQLRRYPAADVLIGKACSWLNGLRDQPFFLWIHLMDPHHPYYPPQEALSSLGILNLSAKRARFLNSSWNRGDIGPGRLQRYKAEIISLYDAGVHWADKQLARLVAALQQLQRWDDTAFVVTADHGEEFLEHGDRYHSPTSLPEQLIHVPLLVRAPGLSGGTTLSGPFSLIHLAPTLLEAIGAEVPHSFQGRSHWGQLSAGKLPSEPAIAECAEEGTRTRLMTVRDGNFKLVIRFRDQTDTLYDLKNDPGERSPLSDAVQKNERVQLLQIARRHLRESREGRDASSGVRARLREIRRSLDRRPTQSAALETVEHG